MKTFPLRRYAFSVSAVCALLAGCGGGSQPPISMPGAMPQTSALAAHADRGTSWMLPEAKADDLLYASNDYGYGANDVFVFSYKQRRQVGLLTGFPATVAGLCSDASGDVFVVTNSYGSSGDNYIYEFPHGSSESSATLDDGAGDPWSCAFDKTTGNLAVTNFSGFYSKDHYGNVAIYKKATGTASVYADPSYIENPNYCAYDADGNLYLDDGSNSSSGDKIAELPGGTTSFVAVTLSQAIGPESLQWKQGRLVMSGGGGNGTHGSVRIYEAKISGTKGIVTGPTYLYTPNDRKARPYVQFWIQGGSMAGPAWTPQGDGRIDLWKWPRGGNPTKSIFPKGAKGFVGVTVSSAASSK